VGSSVVNALSTKLIAEVVQKGELYRLEFAQGATLAPLKKVGKTDRPTGTSITFYPDPTIFKETIEFDYKWVVDYLRHQAYLTKGVYVAVRDERSKERAAFYFEGGIQSYVKHLNIGKEVVDNDIFYVNVLSKAAVPEVVMEDFGDIAGCIVIDAEPGDDDKKVQGIAFDGTRDQMDDFIRYLRDKMVFPVDGEENPLDKLRIPLPWITFWALAERVTANEDR
jgi:hypothetical protein